MTAERDNVERFLIDMIKRPKYCKRCASDAFSDWKGWPLKDSVPLLSIVGNRQCEQCGGSDAISGEQITWLNHGPGLPDYWTLEVDEDMTEWGRKWGHPYYGEVKCRKCLGRSIVSEHTPGSNVTLKASCSECGLSRQLR